MRFSVLCLSPGAGYTSVLICRAAFWRPCRSPPGWWQVLPRGHEQKVACTSALIFQTWPKGGLWAAPRSVKPRAQIVPFLAGRCFAPDGFRWEKTIRVALLLCLRQPCCSRGMITELDSRQEGIWGQSRCFCYNSKACHILALLFLPTFLVLLFFFYLLWSLHFQQVWADVILWLFL